MRPSDELAGLPLRAAVRLAHALGHEALDHLRTRAPRAVRKALPALGEIVDAADRVAGGAPNAPGALEAGDLYALASRAVDLSQPCKEPADRAALDALAGVGYAVDSYLLWSAAPSDLGRALVLDNVARALAGVRAISGRAAAADEARRALVARVRASGAGDRDPVD